MPYRLALTGDIFSRCIECSILSLLAVCQGLEVFASVITENDWEKLTGPHALAFASTIATLVLWATGVVVVRRLRLDSLAREARDRKDALEREIRDRSDRAKWFRDLMESNREFSNKLESICNANHEVILTSSRTDMKVAEAIHSLETQVQHLTNITPLQQFHENNRA
jgi:hypothetical protein